MTIRLVVKIMFTNYTPGKRWYSRGKFVHATATYARNIEGDPYSSEIPLGEGHEINLMHAGALGDDCPPLYMPVTAVRHQGGGRVEVVATFSCRFSEDAGDELRQRQMKMGEGLHRTLTLAGFAALAGDSV